MQINIGTPERIARLMLGLVLLVLPLVVGLSGIWVWLSGLVGVVLIATGALRFCPAWSLLGITTAGRK